MLLNALQISALNKIGDVYCPGDQEFPQFSKLGNVENIDVLLNELPASDLQDLKLLLFVLGLLPSLLVRGFIAFVEFYAQKDLPLGSLFRTVRFGFRGLIFALYYSGLKGKKFSSQTPSELIGYNVQVKL